MMTRTAMGIKNDAGVLCAHAIAGCRAFTICVWNTEDSIVMVRIKRIIHQITLDNDELDPHN